MTRSTQMKKQHDLRNQRARLASIPKSCVGRPRQRSVIAPLQDWTVLICTRMTEEARAIAEWTADRGGLPLRPVTCSELLCVLTTNGGDRAMLVLGPELADNLAPLVERCLEFRARFPASPILLMLPDVANNDFSTTRAAICDVTLRTPVSQAAFEDAIVAAMENNRDYRARFAPHALDQFGDSSAGPKATSPRRRGQDLSWCQRLLSMSGLARGRER